jgi:hypothetical protein
MPCFILTEKRYYMEWSSDIYNNTNHKPFLVPYLSGIRHPEEISISRKLCKEDLKYNNANPRGRVQKKHRDRMSANGNLSSNSSNHLSSNSVDGSGSPFISRSPMTPSTPQVGCLISSLMGIYYCLLQGCEFSAVRRNSAFFRWKVGSWDSCKSAIKIIGGLGKVLYFARQWLQFLR